MKRKYVVPDIEVVEFELNDIITHSMAMGDDENGNNDTSFDDFGDIWFNGTGYSFRMGGQTFKG